MMNVLMISTDRALFDPESYVRARIAEQAELAHRLDVIVLTPKGSQYKVIKVSPHLTIHPTSSSGKWAYLPDAFRIGSTILSHTKERHKWLITTQDPFETGALGYMLSLFTGVPLHLQIHTDPWSSAWRKERTMNSFRFYLMRYLLPRAAGIRVVSQRVEESLRASGIPHSRITRVPIFTDVVHWQKSPATFDLHESYRLFSKIVLSIGRLEHEKNYHGLIRAFARVHKVRDDTMLLVVGAGSERERLVALANSLDLRDAVMILPWARDVVSYYKTSDCYVQPSLYEGWGLAVVEAMASGIPVVMTDVGVAGELVRDGETGLVVPTQNEEALSDAILRVLSDDALAKQLRDGAAKEVAKCMTKSETLELYKKSWNDAWKYGNERKKK